MKISTVHDKISNCHHEVHFGGDKFYSQRNVSSKKYDRYQIQRDRNRATQTHYQIITDGNK